jgi:hypothetical protein
VETVSEPIDSETVASGKPNPKFVNLRLEIEALERSKSVLEVSLANLKNEIRYENRAKAEKQRDREKVNQINSIAQILEKGAENLEPCEQALYPFLLGIRNACLDIANAKDTFHLQIDQAKKELDQRNERSEEERKGRTEHVISEYNQLIAQLKEYQRDMDVVIFELFMLRAKELMQANAKEFLNSRFPTLDTANAVIEMAKLLLSEKMVRRRLFSLREIGYLDSLNP